MSDSSLLRAAASRLRELAEQATPGPREVLAHDDNRCGLRIGGLAGYAEMPYADGAYIAAMSPPVGLAVADWLDQMAHGVHIWTSFSPMALVSVECALAVARAVVPQGEQT